MAYNTDTTGSAAKLTTARTINGVSFDGTASITTNNTGWMPSDYGWLAWTHDIIATGNDTALPNGTLVISGIKIPTATTITNVILAISTAGSSLTSGQCFAALFQNGNLLASTADQSSNFTSSGVKTMALTSAQSVSAGLIHVGVFCNGTTNPIFFRASTGTGAINSHVNAGLSSTAFRYAVANTGLTTAMPSTLGTQSSTNRMLWAAVS